ncbi:MAG: hypothetical protein ACTIDN_04985 [Acetobacter sp.]|uniref:hypothetical protein n=1 Tax=Acetobacter sp. TaxID=440 RepID=UPI003F8F8FAB
MDEWNGIPESSKQDGPHALLEINQEWRGKIWGWWNSTLNQWTAFSHPPHDRRIAATPELAKEIFKYLGPAHFPSENDQG